MSFFKRLAAFFTKRVYSVEEKLIAMHLVKLNGLMLR